VVAAAPFRISDCGMRNVQPPIRNEDRRGYLWGGDDPPRSH
jgi:hypothetical protein